LVITTTDNQTALGRGEDLYTLRS